MVPWRCAGLLLGLAAPLGAAAHSAPAPFVRCETLEREAPESWESARCFYEAALRGRLWSEAARRLDALEARHPERPWPRLARAYVEEERDPSRASARYRLEIAAISTIGARGSAAGEVRARCAFAAWLSGRHLPQAAGEQLTAAVRRAEAPDAAGQPDLLAEALIAQARYLRREQADLRLADRLAHRAESLLFPRGPALQQILCLDLLARLSQDLGRPEEAGRYYRQLAPLAHAYGRRDLEAEAQFGLGLLLFVELDRAPRAASRAQAVAQLRAALETAVALADPVLEAKVQSLLGVLEDLPAAPAHAERCVALARGRDDSLATACLLALAQARAETDPRGAEPFLEAARAVAARAGDLASLSRFAYGEMNFSWRLRSHERAVAASLAALQAVEALRDRQLEQAGRTGLFSRWLSPYDAAAGHLLASFERGGDPADLDRAFAIAEARRARVLRDLLSAAPSAPEAAAAPRATRRAIEASLAPGEALLAFQIAPWQDLSGFAGGSWLLVSTRDRTRVYRLPEVDRARLETTVSVLRGLIDRRDGGEADLAAVLYTQLLSRALADLPHEIDRLVIVPDGILHLLPFPVLHPPGVGLPLSDRYRLSLAPSATLWAHWRRQARRPARAALVLADPLRSPPGERGQAGEPGQLPGARREGRHAARRCGAGSELRLGAAAGEAFLKRRDLSSFGVLHLAAHAVAEEASPEASAVLLVADAPGEDGRLQVDEIARLDLRGKLVALSSCRGASGALVGGEGVMSLTRAFSAAGAVAVVGSLWPLRDDDAEAFFSTFYDRLATGDTAAVAFAAAERERRRSGAPAEAWAGFVLSGDGDWRLPPGPPHPGCPWGLGLLAAGGVGGVVGVGYRRLRRRLHRRQPSSAG